jgi:hypothetical protein
MILQLTALLALATPQQPVASAPDAGKLISKAMARYFDASSVVGQLNLTQSAKGVQLKIDTTIQFDKPSQLLIHQNRTGAVPKQMTVVSDGKYFVYTRPEGTYGQDRFIEEVTQKGYTQSYRDIYSASSRALVDRSPILDMVIGRREDLKVLQGRWGAKKVTGRTTIRGTEGYVIEGAYHDMAGAPATGEFQIVVTEEGDVLRYSNTQRIRIPDQTNETIQILSVWEVDLKVNTKTDPARYRVK